MTKILLLPLYYPHVILKGSSYTSWQTVHIKCFEMWSWSTKSLGGL